MEEILYKVYAKLDAHSCIIGVESTAFHTEEELIDIGYIFIDEGSQGDMYGHAQPNYIRMKFGKPAYDNTFKPNFKLVDGEILEVTDEEKAEWFKPAPPQPSEQDLINADIYFQLAELQLAGAHAAATMALALDSKSPRFDTLKKFYDFGIYTDEQMQVFVECSWITPEEYKEITGKEM